MARKTTESRMFRLAWKGSKIPRGATIGGIEVKWTQHGIITGDDYGDLGSYARKVEFGGPGRDEHVMIVTTHHAYVTAPGKLPPLTRPLSRRKRIRRLRLFRRRLLCPEVFDSFDEEAPTALAELTPSMTLCESLVQFLINNGLWRAEAEAVVRAMILEDAAKAKLMAGRWDERADAYPKPMLAVLVLTAKTKAVEWIDANKPMHFARHMLAA